MAKATFDRFDGGLLLARPSSVAPANSLARLINMDVQPGGWLRARPKFKPVPDGFSLSKQWKGLESNGGYLWTFSCWDVASTGLVSDIVNPAPPSAATPTRRVCRPSSMRAGRPRTWST